MDNRRYPVDLLVLAVVLALVFAAFARPVARWMRGRPTTGHRLDQEQVR